MGGWSMTEPNGVDVEEIDVPEVPEPITPDAGEIDPGDDYREGHA